MTEFLKLNSAGLRGARLVAERQLGLDRPVQKSKLDLPKFSSAGLRGAALVGSRQLREVTQSE